MAKMGQAAGMVGTPDIYAAWYTYAELDGVVPRARQAARVGGQAFAQQTRVAQKPRRIARPGLTRAEKLYELEKEKEHRQIASLAVLLLLLLLLLLLAVTRNPQ
jgi:hypothetical protein